MIEPEPTPQTKTVIEPKIKAQSTSQPKTKPKSDVVLSNLETESGKYTIQLVSSIKLAFIKNKLTKLKAKGLPAWTASKKVRGKLYYRLRLGKYKTSKDAKSAAKFYAKYYSEKPFITRTK